MPSSQVHCAGCVVPSGSNANSMPVESNSIHEEKIVSSVPASAMRPGGGLKVLNATAGKEGLMWKQSLVIITSSYNEHLLAWLTNIIFNWK